MKNSQTRCRQAAPFLAVLLVIAMGVFSPAGAALQAVGPVSAANGFPVWYQDTNGLQLELCLDQNGFCLLEEPNPGAPIEFPDNFGAEAFWWAAEAAIDGGGVSGLLTLAMEAAFPPFEQAVEGSQQAFARIRIRIDVTVPGTYTVTHPFGVAVYQVDTPGVRAINETQDIGNLLDPGRDGDFTIALGDGPNPPLPGARVNADGRSIGPFLIPATNPFVTVGAFTYIANPAVLQAVTGSPFGTNFFRVQGPNGLDVQQNFFTLMGKVANCDDTNQAPVARPDTAATTAGNPVAISVLANDTDDVGINSSTIVIAASPANGTAARNANGTITYTPAAGFSGRDTFTYTVQDFCGVASNAGFVTVFVENLQAAAPDFRVRTGRWTLEGSSNFDQLISVPADGQTAFYTSLFGAQEVPPVSTAMRGRAAAIFAQGVVDSFDYSLDVSVPAGSTVTQAHIHVGEPGSNGPVIFSLCTDLGNAPAGVVVPPCTVADGSIRVEGTLDAAALQAQAEQGITSFAEAVAAIEAGRTYVNVHTTANPAGEVRGQVGRNVIMLRSGSEGPAIANAPVAAGEAAEKPWRFKGKSKRSPGAAPLEVRVESSVENSLTRSLRLR